MSLGPVTRIGQAKPAQAGTGVRLHRAFGFGGRAELGPFLPFGDFRNEP
jgi:hypothetical protein